ncbi:prenyltransferase/squalene oxidase repeat-containing protein [Planctomycetota bacterium]
MRKWLPYFLLVWIFQILPMSYGDGDGIYPSDENPEKVELYDKATKEAVARGLQFLADSQNEDGSWTAYYHTSDYSSPHLGVTGICGMAFIAGGNLPTRGPYAKTLNKAVQYILHNTTPQGAITNDGSFRFGYSHAFATLFLSQVYGQCPEREDIGKALANATAWIVNSQKNDGGWRYHPWNKKEASDLTVTVSNIIALRAARNVGIAIDSKVIKRAIKYVEKLYLHRRGFSYSAGNAKITFATNAAGIATMLYSGRDRKDPMVKDAMQSMNYFLYKTNNMDLSKSMYLRKGQYHLLYGNYYTAQVYFFMGGEDWEYFYTLMKTSSLKTQNRNGSWSDCIGSAYGTAMVCLILQFGNNYLPIFQR